MTGTMEGSIAGVPEPNARGSARLPPSALRSQATVWLPMVRTGTGTDIYTHRLAKGLRERGHRTVVSEFEHRYQYTPWLLKHVAPPNGTTVVVTNSWNGFAFERPGLRHVTVSHLCVHKEVLRRHKSLAQSVFHRHCVLPWERRSAASADLMVAVSEDAARAARCWYSPVAVQCILNGVDTDHFRPLPRRDYAADRPISLLFVGSANFRKGVDLLPAIMQRLNGRAVLRTVGALCGSSAFRSTASVEHLGVRRHEELVRIYNDADLLLLPSRQEGFGYVAAEAMACGTPVVASDLSSLPEIVPRSCGRLCPVDDVKAFSDAVLELAEEPGVLAAMRLQARAHAQRNLDASRWIDEMEAALFRVGAGADAREAGWVN